MSSIKTIVWDQSQRSLHHCIFALLLLLTDHCLSHIHIESILVPDRIENGTEDSVILDCIYTWDEEDGKTLVVKWFLDNDPEPIYQWIPEHQSRNPSKRYEDKINMAFAVHAVSKNIQLTKYRAINIIRPSTELSGIYSCHVMSILSQDNREKKMLVYAPPKRFNFNYTRIKQDEDPYNNHLISSKSDRSNRFNRDEKPESITLGSVLTCYADDVFPVPELEIYMVSKNGERHKMLSSKLMHPTKSHRAFDVKTVAKISDEQLVATSGKGPHIFECQLTMDLNGVNETKSTLIYYVPDRSLTSRTDNTHNTLKSKILIFITMFQIACQVFLSL